MKVLLANIPWIAEDGKYGVRAGSRWAHTRSKEIQTVTYYPFPFFLAYTTSLLKKKGVNAKIKDCLAEGMDDKEFISFMKKEKFDILIMETATVSIYNDLKMAKCIKRETGVTLVLCGTHTSAQYREIMEEAKFVDFIMYGEYDQTAVELIKTIEKKGDFSKVDGIVFRKSRKVVANKRRSLINVNELPYPERDELPMKKYNEPFCKHMPNVQMITSRGCPYNCIYCVEPSVYYGKSNFRAVTPEKVVDEIEYVIKKYHPKEIYFDDSSFTTDQERVRKICDIIIERKIKIKWSCMADTKVKYETLKKMKESGCISVKLGVESADKQILKNIRKAFTPDDARRTITDCKKLGIFTHATFMFGLPGETEETISKTIDLFSELKPDTAQFSSATPYPGTDFYKMCKEKGWLVTNDWTKYDGSDSSVISYPNCTKGMIEKAIIKAKKRLFISVLKNPKTLKSYVVSSYKSDGLSGVLKNSMRKVKFIVK
ncbi:MAG: radical SAM protein [Candidatus Aenigmarchaeota archaeon]|nr:radical SAM protein [Candidatus Aenigmarchaeota archaeon]